ncbi:MAG TPA: tripartite tricarboxylate transporter substrate binding protein [Burkholderiales bacterium]|nr:tripartite tricarboxylate transporter substrate binding protein [Burkholderiales bacterium]
MSITTKLAATVRRLAPVALACAALSAHAQESYPARTIRLIVPSSPGGGTDASARIITPKLSERLGQQVVIDYRPGAAAMIGTEAGAKAAPDGYTLLIAQSTMTIVPSVYRKVRFDPQKDFSPISIVAVVPLLLVGHPSLPAKSAKELIALAKARPGQIDYVAGGYGGNSHLAMEHFLSMAGIRMTYVPYKSGNAGLVDALSGRIQVMLSNMLVSLPHVRSGRFRPYGVTSLKRASEVPDIPTLAESAVPGYEAVQWFGILGPAGLPRDIVNKVHRELVNVMQDAEVRKRFASDGADPVYSKTPEEFAALIGIEVAKWAKVVKAAKIELQ